MAREFTQKAAELLHERAARAHLAAQHGSQDHPTGHKASRHAFDSVWTALRLDRVELWSGAGAPRSRQSRGRRQEITQL